MLDPPVALEQVRVLELGPALAALVAVVGTLRLCLGVVVHPEVGLQPRRRLGELELAAGARTRDL